MGMPNVTSIGLVLVMNSIAVMTGGTWVKLEEVRGSGSPSSSRVWTQKNVPLLHAKGWSEWDLNPVCVWTH